MLILRLMHILKGWKWPFKGSVFVKKCGEKGEKGMKIEWRHPALFSISLFFSHFSSFCFLRHQKSYSMHAERNNSYNLESGERERGRKGTKSGEELGREGEHKSMEIRSTDLWLAALSFVKKDLFVTSNWARQRTRRTENAKREGFTFDDVLCMYYKD